MSNISSNVLTRLHAALEKCDLFASDEDLRAAFVDKRISQWRGSLPEANCIEGRVRKVVDFLSLRYTDTQENALVLFLRVLNGHTSSGDALHRDLAKLAVDLEPVLVPPSLPLDSSSPSPPSPSRHIYAFENRVQDLKEMHLILEAQPYLHLYAPSGIGKTYLVKQLLQVYYARRGVYIDFSIPRYKSQCRSAGALLREIQRQICSIESLPASTMADSMRGLASQVRTMDDYNVVVLDNVDYILPSVRLQLREDLLPALQREIDDPTLYIRFIAIAQTRMDELSGMDYVSFQPYLLNAFQGLPNHLTTYKNLLQQAVARWGEQQFAPHNVRADDMLNQWAEALYDLTGGHPGAIERTLNYVGMHSKFSRCDVFELYRQDICERVLAPLIEEQVQFHFRTRPQYTQAFRLLWIFRYLSKSIFKQLLNIIKDNSCWRDLNTVTRKADYGMEHIPLWERLADTPLLQYKGVSRSFSHRLTPIWRRIGNLILRSTDISLYRSLHHDALRIFDSFVLDQYGTDVRLQIDCFVQYLRQK